MREQENIPIETGFLEARMRMQELNGIEFFLVIVLLVIALWMVFK